MKRLLMLTVILASGLLAGCREPSDAAHSSLLQANGRNGLAEEAEVRYRRLDNIDNLNRRMMVDDWDDLWLYRRSSMLTRHLVRVGY